MKGEYLELQHHWKDVISGLAFVTGIDIDPSAYTIICIDAMFIGNGDVEGNGNCILYIARQNANHFVPLVKCTALGDNKVSLDVDDDVVCCSRSSSDEDENSVGETEHSELPLKYICEENTEIAKMAAKAVAGLRSLASAAATAKAERQVVKEDISALSSDSSQDEGNDDEAVSSAYDSDATDLFHLDVECAATWETPQDKDLRVAHLLASQMRRHPLVPSQPGDDSASTSFITVQSGMKLPAAHCAFKGCCWIGPTKDSIENHVVCEHRVQLLAAENEVFGNGSHYGSLQCLSKSHYHLNMSRTAINPLK